MTRPCWLCRGAKRYHGRLCIACGGAGTHPATLPPDPDPRCRSCTGSLPCVCDRDCPEEIPHDLR